jgi:DeoR/GlpR family transcriptional regulator of sugar metabolism
MTICHNSGHMKFYTIAELTKLCHLSERTIRRHIAIGSLVAKCAGDWWLIEETDLQNLHNLSG